jgi:hypothetical protein
MDKETEVKTFEVGDTKLAAYLYCLKFRLAKPPFLKGPVVVFPFIWSPEIDKEVENWSNKTTRNVGLAKYAQYLAHVKALAHNYRKLEAAAAIEEELGGGSNE